MEEQKTLKQYAKEAKKRLKSGFWQNYQRDLDMEINRAKNEGLSVSKVKEYYAQKVQDSFKNSQNVEDEFFEKVKKILDTEGEVSDALGRLTDKEKFNSLSYEEKQRYNLELSEKYLKAVERYNREKAIGV